MRRPRLYLALLAALATASGMTASPAVASSAYCSVTGDLCYAAGYRSGRVILKIDLAAKYFSTVKVCVRPLFGSGVRECDRFAIRQRPSGIYGKTVLWSDHFTNAGHGRYQVTWSGPSGRLGPAVTFTR